MNDCSEKYLPGYGFCGLIAIYDIAKSKKFSYIISIIFVVYNFTHFFYLYNEGSKFNEKTRLF